MAVVTHGSHARRLLRHWRIVNMNDHLIESQYSIRGSILFGPAALSKGRFRFISSCCC